MEDHEKRLKDLMTRIKANLPKLKVLLDEISGHWTYEDCIYRYYHHSNKVQWAMSATLKIHEALQELQDPELGMCDLYTTIVNEGLMKVTDINDNWNATRKWVEAFFHCKYFLEMVVKYGELHEEVPMMLPSGFAAVLELYNLR